MRIWIVVDASIVLSAGVLTGRFSGNFMKFGADIFNFIGILSACALCEKLSRDRILPKSFLYRFPATNAQVVTILVFLAFSGIMYASAGASLTIVSNV